MDSKCTILAAVAALATVVGFTGVARAQPVAVPIQGTLSDADDIPLEGQYAVRFAVYTTLTGGSPEFSETQTLNIKKGVFTAYLGDQSALDAGLFGDQQLYLGITVDEDEEMSPRLRFGAVPYALLAREVASVPSGAVMFFDLPMCPGGWSEFGMGRGRVIVGAPESGVVGGVQGTPLGDLGQRTIAAPPAHTHSVDPAAQSIDVSAENAHTHVVDPDNFVINDSGSHSHSVSISGGRHDHQLRIRNGGNAGDNSYVQGAGFAPDFPSSAPVEDSTSHAHSASASSETHDHGLNLPPKTSTAGSSHNHTANIDLSAFDTDSTGAPTVDVTMPYVQLLMCRKD
ncbi:hypothetical protein [Haliangium sp.]|uniref:hypothetical protein n=1 Tax=Haliangium sp. TaxID=2663208 RepID=UPI003D0D5610